MRDKCPTVRCALWALGIRFLKYQFGGQGLCCLDTFCFGVRCLVFGVMGVGFDGQCLVSGVWCLVIVAWFRVFGFVFLVFGFWFLVFGVWCLVFGV